MSMTMNEMTPASTIRNNWGWFLLLGIVFLLGGVIAIAAPLASSIAIGFLIGAVLVIAGVIQIFQSFRIMSWTGFALQLVVGIIALAGGLAIYFWPVAGALAVTLIIAAIFVAKGVAQIWLAIRIRPHAGWVWILLAGIIALLVGLMIYFQWPLSALWAPGVLAGISLIFTGWSYIMMSMLIRRTA